MPARPTDARRLLADATRRLAAAGVPTPRVDAELLLADVLGISRGRLLTAGEVQEAAAARYALLVERRAAREPLQHITGRAPFRNLELAVGPGVFIPRPESELLVDAVLADLREAAAPLVVDLCAGSGALGLAVADELPSARVVAVESSPAALEWLARNAEGTSVQVVAADVRDPDLLAGHRGAVDAVVANPPYVPVGAAVDPEVRADPAEAVFAGEDGLDVIPAVIDRAADLLRSGGLLAIEHDDTHAVAVPRLLCSDGRFAAVTDHRDLTGRARFTVARRVDSHR